MAWGDRLTSIQKKQTPIMRLMSRKQWSTQKLLWGCWVPHSWSFTWVRLHHTDCQSCLVLTCPSLVVFQTRWPNASWLSCVGVIYPWPFLMWNLPLVTSTQREQLHGSLRQTWRFQWTPHCVLNTIVCGSSNDLCITFRAHSCEISSSLNFCLEKEMKARHTHYQLPH